MKTQLRPVDPVKAKKFFEDKMTFTTGPVELDHMIEEEEDINIVDVRAAEDYEEGHIPGAVNLPQDKWETVEGLEKGKTNVLYCYSHVCHLAAKAAVEFAGRGFPVMEMDGGFKAWKDNELEIES
jgi:rhodanese-related sulfurtransferase